jgi:hypothetical protein
MESRRENFYPFPANSHKNNLIQTITITLGFWGIYFTSPKNGGVV